MGTIIKTVLSGSVDGQWIGVSSSNGSSTVIHTGSSATNVMDEVYLYAKNQMSSTRDVIIEWGGTSSKDLITIPVASLNGAQIIIEGHLLQGNATSKLITAKVSGSDTVEISGFVHRITQ